MAFKLVICCGLICSYELSKRSNLLIGNGIQGTKIQVVDPIWRATKLKIVDLKRIKSLALKVDALEILFRIFISLLV